MKWVNRLLRDDFPFFFACPALMWELFFLYFPVLVLLWYSFVDYGSPYVQTLGLTFAHYTELFSLLYFNVFMNSLLLAATTAAICLLIAYPIAYYIAFKVRRFRIMFLFFLIVPSWTSLVVQIYAWFSLLEKNGFLNDFLVRMGILTNRVHMLNNKFAIMVGMVYCFMPFMALPLYAVLEKMDKKLLEASADLGANRFQTFRRIILPLSMPGVAAGLLLVFVPAFGEFAIPELLGGAKQELWGSLIVNKFVSSRDMHSGSALACIGVLFVLTVMMLVVTLYRFYTHKGPVVASDPVDAHENNHNSNGWGE